VMDVFKMWPVCLRYYRTVSIYTVESHDLQMTHCASGFHSLSQSPAVKEVLKDQDGRKGLIAAICAGTVCENRPALILHPPPSNCDVSLWAKKLEYVVTFNVTVMFLIRI